MQRCLSFSRRFFPFLPTISSILSRAIPPILSSLSIARDPARARSRSAALAILGQLSQRIDWPNVIGNWHLQGDRNWFSEMHDRAGLAWFRKVTKMSDWSCRTGKDRPTWPCCLPGFVCLLIPNLIYRAKVRNLKFDLRSKPILYYCHYYTIAYWSYLKRFKFWG